MTTAAAAVPSPPAVAEGVQRAPRCCFLVGAEAAAGVVEEDDDDEEADAATTTTRGLQQLAVLRAAETALLPLPRESAEEETAARIVRCWEGGCSR